MIYLRLKNTDYNLNERVLPISNEKNNEILITVDSTKFTQQDYQYIQQLSEILDNDNELKEEQLPCKFSLGNLEIEVFKLNTYENELIFCPKL